MEFIWPQHPNPDPGVIGRAGRVIHWAGLILGGLVAAFGVVSMVGASDQRIVVGVGGVIYMVGRGARYILADE